jgi:hypothetical protein
LQTHDDVLDRSVTGVPPIAAMTTDAERECYYRLTKEAAGKGAIVELGAWMGASTAYIAAGIRDSGVQTKAHVYDHFKSKPGHIAKVQAFYDKEGIDKVPTGPCLETFKDNLGPLNAFIEPHPGEIEAMNWTGGPISLLVTDAPKRVPAISAVMTALRNPLQPGSLMAWQDFCHFPSYEIPACLYRLRNHLEFVEAVVPGTTLVFRVKSQWNLAEVTKSALALSRWTPDEIRRRGSTGSAWCRPKRSICSSAERPCSFATSAIPPRPFNCLAGHIGPMPPRSFRSGAILRMRAPTSASATSRCSTISRRKATFADSFNLAVEAAGRADEIHD